MSISPSPLSLSDVVRRLRAAGCVFAEDEARLLISGAQTPADLHEMVERRAGGMPLEYVLGWSEFCGLRVAVDAGVFVPRRRTEFLVRQAAALAQAAPAQGAPAQGAPAQGAPAQGAPVADRRSATRPPIVIVDLCCGSGALGAALAASLGRAELHAADIDPGAVRCARRNVGRFGGQVYEGDLYQPLPASLRGRVNILLANVPYVPTGEVALLPAEARLHESRAALDGGADGLHVLRRVAAGAPAWLAAGGSMLSEISERQAPQAVAAIRGSGLVAQVARNGELHATIVIGTRPA
jgi:release factor glutamine methyltransferase